MNALNGFITKLFDAVLTPLEMMGTELALILISGIFGAVALVVFKHISSQAGIKGAKDKIKGHMIAIRIYQDDLVVVGVSVVKVLTRNLQYVLLNFGPFIPMAPLFVFVVAQTVVRYGFDPMPVVTAEEREAMLPGAGSEFKVFMKSGQEAKAAELEIIWPEGLTPVSPLIRNASRGRAFQEFVASAPGDYQIEMRFTDGSSFTKDISAGETDLRYLQNEKVSDFFTALLWPAEDTFAETCPIDRVFFDYPEADLGWLPLSGPGGVIIWFVLASMVFAFALIKPLGVQI
ncbi:MAG: hypothetical protein ACI9F9_000301 [Candidatus Paceibacteria bacterium]|jgi:hypothetical protein